MLAQARRILTLPGIAVTVLLLAGATYQGVATALERRDFPPPGHRVDVGGHQLHIFCAGEGAPTVVLEAAHVGMSAEWGWVQPVVAEHTRVCSYDRSGLGWSETGDGAYDPARVPDELHTLVLGAHVDAPFVLVGHALGAAFATSYAARYPTEVQALVLVDAPDRRPSGRMVGLMTFAPWLARTGFPRALGLFSREAANLPEPAGGAAGSFLNRPDHLARARGEVGRWQETLDAAAASVVPDTVPIVRVASGNNLEDVLLAEPEPAAAVTRAILEVVETARLR